MSGAARQAGRGGRTLGGPAPDFSALSPGVRLSLAALNARLAALPRKVPENLILGLTARCQLACAHCHHRLSGRARGRDLPAAAASRLLREAAACGIPRVTFFGGEPCLHPALPALVREASALGLFTELDTNGLALLRPSCLRGLAAAGLCAARVSLHSADPRAHDALCGRGSFAKALAALRAAVKSGLLAYISSCVAPSKDGARALLALASRERLHGARFLAYSRPGAPGDAPARLAAALAALRSPLKARACVKAGRRACAAAAGEIVYAGPDGALRDCPYSPLPFAKPAPGGLRAALAARRGARGYPCQKHPPVLVE